MTSNIAGYDESKYAASKIAYLLLLFNIFFLYVRPQETVTVIQPLRLPGLLSMALLAWIIFNLKPYILTDKILRRILILLGIFLIASVGAVNVVGYRLVILWGTSYIPIIVGAFLLVCTSARYQHFMIFWIITMGFVAMKIIDTGGHGPGDFLWDENDVALAMGMALPISFYMTFWSSHSKWKRRLLQAITVLILTSVVMTQSRGGVLGLLSVFGMMWLFSKRKFTILSISLVILLVFSGVIYSILPDGFIEDFVAGLTDSSDSTRVERFRTWEIAWIMFLDNFLLGVGPGNFPWNVGEYQKLTSWWYDGARSLQGRQTHSMYFEIIADIGVVGAFAYYSVIFFAMRRCFQIQKVLKKVTTAEIDSDVKKIAYACRGLFIAMVCYLVSGAFISVTYYPNAIFWLMLCMLTFREYSAIKSKD